LFVIVLTSSTKQLNINAHKKVSHCKQIARQHSCHKYIFQSGRGGRGPPCKICSLITMISFVYFLIASSSQPTGRDIDQDALTDIARNSTLSRSACSVWNAR